MAGLDISDRTQGRWIRVSPGDVARNATRGFVNIPAPNLPYLCQGKREARSLQSGIKREKSVIWSLDTGDSKVSCRRKERGRTYMVCRPSATPGFDQLNRMCETPPSESASDRFTMSSAKPMTRRYALFTISFCTCLHQLYEGVVPLIHGLHTQPFQRNP